MENSKTYDTFTPNTLEMFGKIERKPFYFVADNCKVWHNGHCILDFDTEIEISADVNSFSNELEVNLDNSEITDYITDYFSFSEISLNKDRVLWSNNLLGGCAGTDEYEPTNMSLFYYQGVLSRIYLNITSPSVVMLELTSNKGGKIADIENPLKKMVEKIQNARKNENIDLSNVYFVSNSHQRYENRIPVRGLQQGCKRAVKIDNNINGNDGYTVTVFNLDGNHPMWGNNVQMSPKPMKVIQQSAEKIVLRGFGYDQMALLMGAGDDASFTHYGLSIYLKYGEIDKCVLHMHDRDIDIEYFK